MTEAELKTRIRDAQQELKSKKEMRPAAHQFKIPHAITRTCPVTGKPFTITVEAEDWVAWRAMANPLFPISHYFPYLENLECESLISGISPAGAEGFLDCDTDPECED
jgi:hypothetical protein